MCDQGAYFNSTLALSAHISNLSRSRFYHLRRLRAHPTLRLTADILFYYLDCSHITRRQTEIPSDQASICIECRRSNDCPPFLVLTIVSHSYL